MYKYVILFLLTFISHGGMAQKSNAPVDSSAEETVKSSEDSCSCCQG